MKSYILLGVLAACNQAAVLKSKDGEFDNDPVRMIIAQADAEINHEDTADLETRY